MESYKKSNIVVQTKITAIDDLGKEVPVAPPRRKRPSNAAQLADKQPGGFKELFGNNISRRSSIDSSMQVERVSSAEKEGKEAQYKRSQSAVNLSPSTVLTKHTIENRPVVSFPQSAVPSSTPSPDRIENGLQRKVSRVGNKKSDKFFGENLSDCLSDEPIVGEPVQAEGQPDATSTSTPLPAHVDTKDEIDIFIERNISQQNVEKILKEAIIEPASISITDEIDITSKPRTESDGVLLINEDDPKLPEKHNSLDKKAEFLMAMLDDENLYKDVTDDASTTTGETVVAAPRRRHSKTQEAAKQVAEAVETNIEKLIVSNVKAVIDQSVDDDEEQYKGRQPVEEPIIVPKRKHYGHICDGDHLHEHVHTGHHHESDHTDSKSANVSSVQEVKTTPEVAVRSSANVASEPIACPKKPKRDFALYEKARQNSSSNPSSPEEPTPVKRTLRKKNRHQSAENLLNPETDSSPDKKAPVLARHRQGSNGDEKLESILKKCKSSQSFLTQELMSQIVDRVYGFQDPYAEDHGYDDHSTKVAPNSKLTTRKISTTKRDVSVASIKEDATEEDNSVKTASPLAAENKPDEVIQMKIGSTVETSHPADKVGHVIAEASSVVSPSAVEKKTSEENRQAKKKANEESIRHKKSKEETHSFIEMEKLHAHPGHKRIHKPEHFQTISHPHIAEDIQKILSTQNPDEGAISHVLDDIYKSNSSILDEFQKYLNEGISDDQDSDGKTETNNNNRKDEKPVTKRTTEPNLVASDTDDGVKKLTFVNVNGERRDSIVDVDQWFNKHTEFANQPRRGSESGIEAGYNTKKIFPFGKLDKGPTGASEFFESKATAATTEIVASDEKDTNEEHSTLLKYLK